MASRILFFQKLRTIRFLSIEKTILVVKLYFAELPENHDRKGTKLLQNHSRKVYGK